MIRRRVVRAPASSANLGPGFDCMGAALGLTLELEVEETGEFAVQTDLQVAKGRENLCVRAFERAAPRRGLHLHDQLADTSLGRPRLERGGDRGRADGCRSHVRAGRRSARTRERPRGPPRQRRSGAVRRLRHLCRRSGDALRRADGAGGAGGRPRAGTYARAPRARRWLRRCRARTPCSTSRTRALLTLGLARGDWDLLARGLHDRLHQPQRASLFPRSFELAAAGTRAGCARRDDLRRRPDGAGVVLLRADGRRRRGAGRRDRRLGDAAARLRSRRRAPTWTRSEPGQLREALARRSSDVV